MYVDICRHAYRYILVLNKWGVSQYAYLYVYKNAFSYTCMCIRKCVDMNIITY